MKKTISVICILVLLVSCKQQIKIDSSSVEHIEENTTEATLENTKISINNSDYELTIEEKKELLKDMEKNQAIFLGRISYEDKVKLTNEIFELFKTNLGYTNIKDMLEEGQTLESWFDDNVHRDYFWEIANEKLDLLKYININYKRNIDGAIKKYLFLEQNQEINSMPNKEILLGLLKDYYISGGDSVIIDKKEELMYQNGLDNSEILNNILDDIMYFYNDKIDKQLLSKEYIFLDLASQCGGEEFLGYREDFGNIKITGKTFAFNDETKHFVDDYYDIDYYLDKAIAEIKEKHPDITNTVMLTDEEKKDDEYLRKKLNLSDFGNYKSAFYDCDSAFYDNSLTGKFNNDEERKKAYEEFCKKESIKEKAEFIRNLIGERE